MDEQNCMPKCELSINGVREYTQDLLLSKFPKGYDTCPLKPSIILFHL